MKCRLLLSILLGLCPVTVTSATEKEEPPAKNDLVIGVVYRNSVFTANGSLTLYQGDLFGPPHAVRRLTGYLPNAEESQDFPPRSKLDHGELVFADARPS